MAERQRFCTEPSATAYPMADGSAALIDGSTGRLHALNADATEIWQARRCWSEAELRAWLTQRGYDDETAASSAHVFLMSLVATGLMVPERTDD